MNNQINQQTNQRIEDIKLELDLFLCNLKELDNGLGIVNLKATNENNEFTGLCEDFKWEWNDGILYINDNENNIEIEINNETSIKDDDNSYGDIIIDDKWILEKL